MTEQQEGSPSMLYLAYTFGGALVIIATLIYAGIRGWPFVATVLVGALVQLGFRALKRVLRGGAAAPESGSAADSSWSLSDSRKLVLAYVVMIGVCALWYGIGRLIQWV